MALAQGSTGASSLLPDRSNRQKALCCAQGSRPGSVKDPGPLRNGLRAPLVVLALVLTLPGCGEHAAGNLGEDATAPAPEPELVIRLGVQYDPSQKAWVAADAVRRELEQRSGGRIRVRFYDSAVLGAERELLEQCYLGILDMVQVTSSVLTTLDPLYSTLDMPYLFVDEQHQQRVLDGPIGQELMDDLRRYRLQGLAFYCFGFRNVFTSSGRPITCPKDMEGLKIRVMESPVMIRTLNAMGASAVPLNAAELYSALKAGVVDGAENNPQTFISAHLSDACKHYSFTRHFGNQAIMVANKQWLEGLDPELRDLVRRVPREVTPEFDVAWAEAVREALSAMDREGVTVNRIENVTPFIEHVRPVYDQYQDAVPPELVRRIRAEAGP